MAMNGGGHKRPSPSGGPGMWASGPPSKRSGAGASVGGAADEPAMDDMIEDAVEAGAEPDDMPIDEEEFIPVSG